MAKPRTQKLKVFKTPIGFHDAYVAASSRKAALTAWGASTDLFSAGIAELVTDQGAGAKTALERPGEVVRIGRAGGEVSTRKGARPAKIATKAKARPKPGRAGLDKAEAALAALEQARASEQAKLAKAEAALAKRRQALEAKHSQARKRAEEKKNAAEARYRAAMADWLD